MERKRNERSPSPQLISGEAVARQLTISGFSVRTCCSCLPRRGFSFAIRPGGFELLQKPEGQERQKNAGNQSQVGMGEYFLADTTLQIRQVSRKGVADGTLKTEA